MGLLESWVYIWNIACSLPRKEVQRRNIYTKNDSTDKGALKYYVICVLSTQFNDRPFEINTAHVLVVRVQRAPDTVVKGYDSILISILRELLSSFEFLD